MFNLEIGRVKIDFGLTDNPMISLSMNNIAIWKQQRWDMDQRCFNE